MNHPTSNAPGPEPEEADFEEEIPEPRGLLYERLRAQNITLPLVFVAMCVALTLVFWFSPSYRDLLWASGTTVLHEGQYWRLFTALFIHADIEHLLSNLPFVLLFSWLLRNYFGLIAFPLAALLVGVLANFVTLLFYADYLRLVGASGMIHGMVAMWVAFYLRYEIRFALAKKLLRVVGFLLVLLFPTSYSPTTSYVAHVVGFIFGLACALILISLGPYEKLQEQRQASREHELR